MKNWILTKNMNNEEKMGLIKDTLFDLDEKKQYEIIEYYLNCCNKSELLYFEDYINELLIMCNKN